MESAYVIKIGNRYFCKKGKKGRVQTSWSLAGARFYGDRLLHFASDDLSKDISFLNSKKKKYTVHRVSVVE